jgi:ABC-2 type transport system ATP-binding protein
MIHSVIRTENLVKTYSKLQAVNGLNLNVPEGSIYGLLGRNSSGKTTTIRMAMGLARPTKGTIRVFGLDPSKDPERVKVLSQVGYVPEDKAILGLTMRRLLSLNRSFYPDTWSDEIARKVVDRLELDLDQPMIKLSLGNKTKASLACAIAQRSLLRLIVEDCTSEGRTVFLSSHQLNEIEQIADHIGIMDRGRLLIEGPLDEIRSRFRRVTVTGEGLPTHSSAILSSRPAGHATQYVLQHGPLEFMQQLSSNGATVVDDVPLSLNEIFLELCRKDEGRLSLDETAEVRS